uniref:Uncharacterized protein n=1 Tax=Knipowitschia caucasica TaxID=637954 RepID=A0AAV2KWD7_KNICA
MQVFFMNVVLQVVSAKDLQLVAQLHTSQETWHKTAENCSLYINTKDSEELKFLSGLAELWRVELRRFMSELKRRDRDQSQVLCGLQQDISKWRVFCSSQTE